MSSIDFITQWIPQTGKWAQTILANTVAEWVAAAGVFVVFTVLFQVILDGVVRYLAYLSKRTNTAVDDALVSAVRAVRPSFYTFAALYIALQTLTLPGLLDTVLGIVFIVWVVWQAITVLQVLVDKTVEQSVVRGKDDPARQSAYFALRKVIKAALWALGVLFILSNLGVNITSLVAGLGIGGIAIALALQNILGDLFSSFALYFDKPFEPGDFIIVDKYQGTVERIGIKTTRLRALQGEEIVISNRQLTEARVQNFKKMEERRVTFTFGVEYATPQETLKNIPRLVEEAIEKTNKTSFEFAALKEFGDSAYVYEVVYYIASSDYNTYKAIHEQILLALAEMFKEEDIVLAYPTQTVFVSISPRDSEYTEAIG